MSRINEIRERRAKVPKIGYLVTALSTLRGGDECVELLTRDIDYLLSQLKDDGAEDAVSVKIRELEPFCEHKEGCKSNERYPSPLCDCGLVTALATAPTETSVGCGEWKRGTCPRCAGSGFESDSHTPCEWCGGDGWMPVVSESDLAAFPASTEVEGETYPVEHDLRCQRWVPYDEHHRRYDETKGCTCGPATPVAQPAQCEWANDKDHHCGLDCDTAPPQAAAQPKADPVERRPYCQHCHGRGWFDGLEIPCRWCNPGGDFRSLGLGSTTPSTTPPATAAVEAAKEIVGVFIRVPKFVEDRKSTLIEIQERVAAIISNHLPAQQPEVEKPQYDLDPLEFWQDLAEVLGHARPEKVDVPALVSQVAEMYVEVSRLKGEIERLTKLNAELKIIVDVGTSDDPATGLSKLHKIQHAARADAIEECATLMKGGSDSVGGDWTVDEAAAALEQLKGEGSGG